MFAEKEGAPLVRTAAIDVNKQLLKKLCKVGAVRTRSDGNKQQQLQT